ncbi:MAG TPA: response regulator [Bacteroidales bacterium]|nr:response regulator [Bacteroidales bacterium]
MRNILLADDDPDYLFLTSAMLRKMGFNVLSAHSQKEAEKIMSEVRPDLAIFDLMMEHDDSGFILCHKLRALHPGVPIILATAVAAETGMQFGNTGNAAAWVKADRILEKGIRAEQLEAVIDQLIPKK